MRRFIDRSGCSWDVIVGRQSWGSHCALFVPAHGIGPARQVILRSDNVYEATGELERMTDNELQELLDRSTDRENE